MTRHRTARSSRALTADDFTSVDDNFASREKSWARKTGQLCGQVQRTLAFLLESEVADECLQGLTVEAVLPYPHSGCLLVVLRPWDRTRSYDLAPVMRRLGELKGYWRSEIGRAINRKRTPELVFQLGGEGGRL